MRRRVEDLGRLFTLISDVLDRKVFDLRGISPDNFGSWFMYQTEELQEDIIQDLAHSIYGIYQDLLYCAEIAAGNDFLNNEIYLELD